MDIGQREDNPLSHFYWVIWKKKFNYSISSKSAFVVAVEINAVTVFYIWVAQLLRETKLLLISHKSCDIQ